MYQWELDARGFSVRTSGDAAAALDAVTEATPDVVVTDFTLPSQDGLKLAEQLRDRAATADLAILLVTGHTFTGEMRQRVEEVCDALLVKPLLPEDLVTAIKRALIQRTRDALQRHLAAIRAELAGDSNHDDSAAARVLRAVNRAVGVLADAPAALVVDGDARYVEVNEAACALTRRTRDELLALSVWDLAVAVEASAGRRMWDDFVAAGSMTGSFKVRQADGEPVPTQFAAQADLLPGCHLSLLTKLPEVIAQ